MKIHLSEATNKELAGTGFITEYRGGVPVKVSHFLVIIPRGGAPRVWGKARQPPRTENHEFTWQI